MDSPRRPWLPVSSEPTVPAARLPVNAAASLPNPPFGASRGPRRLQEASPDCCRLGLQTPTSSSLSPPRHSVSCTSILIPVVRVSFLRTELCAMLLCAFGHALGAVVNEGGRSAGGRALTWAAWMAPAPGLVGATHDDRRA